ncbi:MAG: hypothetical protein JWO88_3247 [Frankiales bacterium]|nr:hypothetical protein [Frankiales bacterium]
MAADCSFCERKSIPPSEIVVGQSANICRSGHELIGDVFEATQSAGETGWQSSD